MTNSRSDVSSQQRSTPVAGPPPLKQSQIMPPGVRDAGQLPPTAVTLRPGTTVSGRFAVVNYLGSSSAGISYLCADNMAGGHAVLKILAMPEPDDKSFNELCLHIRAVTAIAHPNISHTLGIGRTAQGELFLALEYVDGATLPQVLARWREANKSVAIQDAFKIIAHICQGLSAVHPTMAHGLLTPYNIHINKQKIVKINNLAFGKIVGDYLPPENVGPLNDSVFVAPEVRHNPKDISPRSDVFSLSMLLCELLSRQGLSTTDDTYKARRALNDVLDSCAPALREFLTRSLTLDPDQRPASVIEFYKELKELIENSAELYHADDILYGFPVEDFVEGRYLQQRSQNDDDIFNIPELSEHSIRLADVSGERYLVQKGGLDYGPFNEQQIVEQLYRDEIDENSLVLDRLTQVRKPLLEFDAFHSTATQYIPVREARREQEAEARAQLQQKVKQGGKAALVVAIIVGVGILLSMVWFWIRQPDPVSLPLQDAFARVDYHFSPPPKEFQAVAMDSKLLQSIFNPQATRRSRAKTRAKSSNASARRATSNRVAPKGSANARVDDNSGAVDFTQGGGSTHFLTDEEIVAVVMARPAKLRECFMLEYRRDNSFRGVTVQFFIRPSGTTGGVKIVESKYQGRDVEQCFVQHFRSLKFPEHGAISNRGVTYPIFFQ